MKCRRCKTIFDYENSYGICPKCACYNRPDGKDEMKTFLGDESDYIEEEYHPPVMSSEGMAEFLRSDNTLKNTTKKQGKSRAKQKDFQERLSNPYLDQTVKKRKEKTASAAKEKRSSNSPKLLLYFTALLVLAGGKFLSSERGMQLLEQVQEVFQEQFGPKSDLDRVLAKDNQTYSDGWSVLGRSFAFGSPFELVTKDYLEENETLLVIPYKAIAEDFEYADDYSMDCYLNHRGLYLRPVPSYIIEELYHTERAGDLDPVYDTEEKFLVFAGDFSEEENGGTVYLNLAFTEKGESMPQVICRVAVTGGTNPKAVWTRGAFGEEVLEDGYDIPQIEKIGSLYKETGAREGYVFCRAVQKFENHGWLVMEFPVMSSFYIDATNGEPVYEWPEEEDYDLDNPLDDYKHGVVPPGELGVRTVILEVPKECRTLKAVFYHEEGREEWTLSL